MGNDQTQLHSEYFYCPYSKYHLQKLGGGLQQDSKSDHLDFRATDAITPVWKNPLPLIGCLMQTLLQ